MPHKTTGKTQGAVDHVSTLRKLAKSLGVSDDTLTQWRRRGMPDGPPYSITATYLWARGEGLRPKLPADERLAKLCKVGSVEAPADDAEALPGFSAYDKFLRRARPANYGEALKREQVIGEEIANKTKLAELEKSLGKLFSEDQMRAREAEFDRLLLIELAKVSQFAMDLVPTQDRDRALAKAKVFLGEVRTKIAEIHRARNRG